MVNFLVRLSNFIYTFLDDFFEVDLLDFKFSFIVFFIYYITTIFITIIMLNLLITIIGDTYNSIKEANVEVIYKIIFKIITIKNSIYVHTNVDVHTWNK